MVDTNSGLGAPLAVITVNSGLTIAGWNARAEQIFGTGPADAVGRGLDEVLPLVDGARWQSALAGADEATPRVWPVRRAGSTWMFEAWTQATRDGAGAAVGFTLYGHDASARVAAEQRAALESTMLAAIKDNLDIALWAIDREGLVVYHGGRGALAAGIEPGSLAGKNMFELYPTMRGSPVITRPLAGEMFHSGAIEMHDHFWDTWFVPIPPGRSAAAIACITLEVTEAKRRELELQAKLELIERQQEVIRELATPIIEVWDGVLTLPIVGLVDTARAADVMDNLLQTVTRSRARFAILDLTGVEVVDTSTASHLIKMIQAIGLLGAEGILTGIHPTIAQTMVALGIDLSQVRVFAKLRDALRHCIRSAR